MQDDLVRRLSTGRHPLNASRADSAEDVRKSLQRGFILLRFPEAAEKKSTPRQSPEGGARGRQSRSARFPSSQSANSGGRFDRFQE